MEIELKEISSGVVIVAAFFGLWYKIRRSAEKIESVEKVLYKDDGALNVMTRESCGKERGIIEASIAREADITAQILERVDILTENVITLMVHQGLEPKRRKPSGKSCTVYRQRK